MQDGKVSRKTETKRLLYAKHLQAHKSINARIVFMKVIQVLNLMTDVTCYAKESHVASSDIVTLLESFRKNSLAVRAIKAGEKKS